jgi:dihydroflavonol-4-reductase
MKAFVTGGSGYIGYHLVRDLLHKGYTVSCLYHSKGDNFKGLDVEIVDGDLLSIESMYPLLKDVDVVFHLAALFSFDESKKEEMYKTNLSGTKALSFAAKKANVSKFIHFSPIEVFAPTSSYQTITEQNPLISTKIHPNIGSYTLSKVQAHNFILDQIAGGLNASIIIPTGVIGPHPKLGAINNIIKKIAKKKFCFFLNRKFNLVDARDVSKAAIACFENSSKGSLYIVAGEYISIKNIVKMVENILTSKIIALAIPYQIIKFFSKGVFFISSILGKKIMNKYFSKYLCSCPKNISDQLARNELNHLPRPFIETIKDILAL